MEDGAASAPTEVSEPAPAAPPMISSTKTASQRSFKESGEKESTRSRRASFGFDPAPSIKEDAPVAFVEVTRDDPPFSVQPSPGQASSPAGPNTTSSKPKVKSTPSKTSARSNTMDFDTLSIDSKANSIQTRNSIRDYIRNERDTIMRKNMALYETLKSEDNRREQFQTRQLKQVARNLPIYVLKLIGNLKRNVHKTMREKGGTPFSIIRGMFLHWDAQKNGALSFQNFANCLNHLGVLIPDADLRNIFNYYSKKSATGETLMGYDELLADIQHDEPTLLEFYEPHHHTADNKEMRFAEHKDRFAVKPEKVLKFIEAIRHHVLKKMRAEGGTLEYHISKVFNGYDFDYQSSLRVAELREADRNKFNINISLKDCEEIVAFYDRKGIGEMDHRLFVQDICANRTSMLAFEEQTAELIEAAKQKINSNPFIRKPYKPASNRVLEKLKDAVHESLDYRLFKVGGSYTSWIHEAFAFWDPKVRFVTQKMFMVEIQFVCIAGHWQVHQPAVAARSYGSSRSSYP
jgi:Ca2+-binding EF-hand superfamily protein